MANGRICGRCGKQNAPLNSPICGSCRYHTSKKPCPISDCGVPIAPNSTTCFKHRRYQLENAVTHCIACNAELGVGERRVCRTCQTTTYELCLCGCGRYRRKWNMNGLPMEYISGHNDSWVLKRRPPVICLVCGESFQAAASRQKLCGVKCRTEWFRINAPKRHKRINVNCSICGTVIYRQLNEIKPGRAPTCSAKCRYILVANKLKGPVSDRKRLALRRDGARCRICGFDTLVHVHHIVHKAKGGDDEITNLIVLCPNHHAMAHRGLIDLLEYRYA